MDYIPRVGEIIVTTLTNANTWYEVLTATQANSIRGLKIKSRYIVGQAQKPFDLALSSSPGNDFYSNSGAGVADAFSPSSGIFCRSSVGGCIIEVMVFK